MSAKVINRVCLSVPGGWQSQDTVTGVAFGPVYNKLGDLFDWQKDNPVEGMKLSKNLMSGEWSLIDEDTPWCCNPASESYWSA